MFTASVFGVLQFPVFCFDFFRGEGKKRGPSHGASHDILHFCFIFLKNDLFFNRDLGTVLLIIFTFLFHFLKKKFVSFS
jgi:hypothetical protein